MVIELGHAILKDKQMTILEVKEKHGQLFLKVDFVSHGKNDIIVSVCIADKVDNDISGFYISTTTVHHSL
jgi:hypothetical protein